MKKNGEPSIWDVIFPVAEPPKAHPSPAPSGWGRPKKDPSSAGKRPWSSNKEECPNCGSLMPSGGSCPGCGLHDEEMRWE